MQKLLTQTHIHIMTWVSKTSFKQSIYNLRHRPKYITCWSFYIFFISILFIFFFIHFWIVNGNFYHTPFLARLETKLMSPCSYSKYSNFCSVCVTSRIKYHHSHFVQHSFLIRIMRYDFFKTRTTLAMKSDITVFKCIGIVEYSMWSM